MVSSSYPWGGPRRALPVLWSPEKQNKRRKQVISQYTLRLDWGTSAKEEDANTRDFSRDL